MLLTAQWPCFPATARQLPRRKHRTVAVAADSSSQATGYQEPPRVSFRTKQRSTWRAKEDGGGRGGGADYLYELGASSNVNLNIDTAQNIDHIDSLFAGSFLGLKSDIADGSLQKWDFRTYNNIVGDYYVSPRFMERVALHLVKNFLADNGGFDKFTSVPLILGIWGEKGMGKTFQTELTFKKMGVEPITMSAGELEHEWAGTPGKLIRERYRRAAEVQKVWGKLSCLVIHDIDAGIGHMGNTQVTVNNQIVVGTLMNICDHPNNVSTGGDWREGASNGRIPIIVTGNDFSTVFAPLIRDGRMDKFYWKAEREDVVAILFQMFKEDGVSPREVGMLRDAFPTQPLDFFGALRASAYDNYLLDWLRKDVIGHPHLNAEEADFTKLGPRLLKKDDLPDLNGYRLTMDKLMEEGQRLVMEQENVLRHRLSEDYMKGLKNSQAMPSLIGLQG